MGTEMLELDVRLTADEQVKLEIDRVFEGKQFAL